MKRYWKLITLVGVIVLTFSTFYIHSSLAFSKLPQFVITHESGGEEVLENVLIQGYYNSKGRNENVTIDQEGSTYMGYPSYLDLLSEDFLPAVVRDLQEDYRGFMRDKQDGMAVFYEDDAMLVYANTSMDFHYENHHHLFTIEIELLDKKTQEKTKFTSPVPKPEQYDFLFAEDVQVVHGEYVKLFTQNALRPDYDQDSYNHIQRHDEIHVYTFDLADQSLINDEVIETDYLDVDGNNVAINSVPLFTGDSLGASEYIVFEINAEEVTQTHDGYLNSDVLDRSLMAYHVESGEQTVLDLPEAIDEYFYPQLYRDSIIYFEKYDADQYEVILYDHDQAEMIAEQTIDLQSFGEEWPEIQLAEDKIYIVSYLKTNENEAFIEVLDLRTSESLYKGAIEIEGEAYEEYRLELYPLISE